MLMLAAASAGLWAQVTVAPVSQNVVQLGANGSVEVQQDTLSIALSTTRDGVDANAVQSQLKTALDVALTEAKKAAVAGQMEVRTGSFSLLPRYGRDSKLTGWQGSAELVLEGKDVARISATAGKLQTLTVSNVQFSLSREQRALAEAQAQGMAIARFRSKAGEIAKSFGFSGYTLREVAINANDQGVSPRIRMMAADSLASAAPAPLPVEAGKSTVLVTVSGSVQLH
jgi:predicted secreted protein